MTERSRNTWMIRTMISARNFCHGQMSFLQNAGNNTEIKPLRRAANYSGVPTVERLHLMYNILKKKNRENTLKILSNLCHFCFLLDDIIPTETIHHIL